MEIHPLSRLDLSVPLNSAQVAQNDGAANRQVVMAVKQVNQSELLGQDRELIYRRDQKTGKLVAQTVDRANGNVLDQVPLEVLLRMQAESAQRPKAAAQSASSDLA